MLRAITEDARNSVEIPNSNSFNAFKSLHSFIHSPIHSLHVSALSAHISIHHVPSSPEARGGSQIPEVVVCHNVDAGN